jgi:hypothetical protein
MRDLWFTFTYKGWLPGTAKIREYVIGQSVET